MHACYRFLILALLLGLSFDASARHHGHGPQPPAETGVFDYYLLSLSWSPTYCETHAGDASQCSQKHFGFVLHGLWPQYAAGGYPQDCATDQQLTSNAVACSGPELSEVRVCVGRDLTPVACGKGVSNSCRNGPIRVPSVR